jgi:hypothetical protein
VFDPPVIVGQDPDPLITNEDTPLEITFDHLLVTDEDNVYPNDFTLTVLEGDDYTVAGNTITPSPDFTGNLTVPIALSDGDNTVSFDLQVYVTQENDPPVFSAIPNTSINEDNSLDIDLNLYASDADDDPLTFTAEVSDNESVTISIEDGQLTVTPVEHYFDLTGINITVTVTDIFNEEDSDSFILFIEPVNDSPEITGQYPLETPEEASLVIALDDLIVTDIDNIYPDDFILTVLEGENYTLDGETITPQENYNGDLTVQVYVSDGSPAAMDLINCYEGCPEDSLEGFNYLMGECTTCAPLGNCEDYWSWIDDDNGCNNIGNQDECEDNDFVFDNGNEECVFGIWLPECFDECPGSLFTLDIHQNIQATKFQIHIPHFHYQTQSHCPHIHPGCQYYCIHCHHQSNSNNLHNCQAVHMWYTHPSDN